MKVILALAGILAVANAAGSYTSQYTQHSHAVVAHAVQPVYHAPAPLPVLHAAPAAIVHHTPVVHTTTTLVKSVPTVHLQPAYYKQAILPAAYASTYSYRAPPAKVLTKVVAPQPLIYAAPQPILHKTIVPTAYATGFSYRAAPAVAVAHAVHHHAPSTVLLH